ncbi:hypothetical protein ELQ19_03405 [Neisseria meningitidis]|nr:hypothetical protein [Neisseria meningitidis]
MLPLPEGLDSRLRGNDGRAVSVAPDKCRNLKSRHSLKTEKQNQKPKIPSFPQLFVIPVKAGI